MPDPPAQERRRFLRGLSDRASSLATAAGILVAGSTLAGFLGSLTWYLDLFSHFRVQYFAVLVLLSAILLLLRHRRLAICFALLALVNLATILPLFFGGFNQAQSVKNPLRAVLLNVNTRTGDPQRISRMLRQLDPDIIALEEVDDLWIDELQEVLAHYPHAKVTLRDDNFGVALYSKLPLSSAEIITLGSAGLPSVRAAIETGTEQLQIIVTHPLPPIDARNWRARNEQLAELALFVRQLKSPVVVLGDLNVTPWSPHFSRLLSDSGLQDSAHGFGVQPTWPTWFAPMLIPIDHCLHSDDVYIITRGVGPDVGSDHFPLVVDFSVAIDGV